MTETFTPLVAERDDELREELIGQLRADEYQARPSRTTNETRCRAGHHPDLLLLGELDDPTAALRLLRELRSSDPLVSRTDPALPVIVRTPDEGEWVLLRRSRRAPTTASGGRLAEVPTHLVNG
jgi:hypothetical protein